MSNTNQPRRPSGTPSGGQWAPTAHDEADIDLGGPGQASATDDAALRMADSREVADRIRALPGEARSQLAKDAGLFPGAVLTMGDVELYEQGQRLPMAPVLEVASATTETVEQGEDALRERHPDLFDDDEPDDEDQLWSGWDDGDRPRLLTLKESDQVKAWRAVASRYRHGDCGRESHKTAPGCDIVCVLTHSKFEGDEGANEALRKPPWEKSYRRPTTEESNAVTDLMCRLVMHVVPKPEAAQPGPKDQPCDGKAGHPARDCHACAVESERQMLFSMYRH